MKKTIALFLAMMAVFALGVCAITLDTAENAAEAVAEEAVLAASANVELKPGLNIWTGTTDPYDFETEVDTTKFNIGDAVTVDVYPTDGTNHALGLLTQFEDYMGLKDEYFPVIEKERPVYIAFKMLKYPSRQIRFFADSTLPTSETDSIYNNGDVVGVGQTGDGKLYEFTNVVATQTSTKLYYGGSLTTSTDTFNAPYEGRAFNNLVIYRYGTTTKTKAYVDDISIIPYYKLSYDLNGGEGMETPASVYFYAEDGGCYTGVADGSALTKDGKTFAGWALTADATPNDIIDKIYPVPGSDITLYAVYGEAEKAVLKPGLNLFTGTTNALTFEGNEKYLSKFLTNGAVVETYAHGEDTDNKVLKFTAGNQYFAVRYFPETEADRPFDVKLDVYYTGQVRIMDNNKYDSELETKADTVVIFSNSTNSWLNNKSYTIKGTNTDSQGTSGHYDEGYYGDAFKNLFVYSYNSVARIDNLNITPYYKITYNANGGTGSEQAAEYFYVASDKSYTLKNTTNDLVKGDLAFCGWATKADATVADVVTSIKPTLGEDVTLYAVYAKPITVTLKNSDGTTNQTISTAAGKNVTITAGTFTSAGADTWAVSWVTEDGKKVYNTTTSFEEDTVLYAVERSRNFVIGENIIVNGDLEGEGIPMRNTVGFAEIVDSGDEAHGKVFKYSRGDGSYSSLQYQVNWENGRKYRIEFDMMINANSTPCYNTVYGNTDHAVNLSALTPGVWNHYALDYIHTSDASASSSDALSIYCNPIKDGENVIYHDNFYLAPYHKVTFNANGAEGTAPEVDWTLAKTYEITAGAGEMVKDGFYFAGWATSADGEAVDSVATVAGEDITLYAVWAPTSDENAPVTDTENFSLRVGTTAGMRFYASVTAAQRNSSVEYGFVAARADILEALGYNAAELTLNLNYNGDGEGKLFVKGSAYKVENGEEVVDKYVEITDDGDYIFAAVCTGIDATNKTQVTTQFVVRPYINIGGVYAYGKPVVKSLYEVAKDVDTTELPDDVQTYVETIITTAEATDAE